MVKKHRRLSSAVKAPRAFSAISFGETAVALRRGRGDPLLGDDAVPSADGDSNFESGSGEAAPAMEIAGLTAENRITIGSALGLMSIRSASPVMPTSSL